MVKKKILVVAAHPDDELLGIGGTLCKHLDEGDEVSVCIVTKAYEPEWSKAYMDQKIKEQQQVDAFLGIKQRINLDLPTVKLNTLPCGQLNKTITSVVEKIQPDIVYTHGEGDLNYDHTLIYRACLVATRPPIKTSLFCFETVSETEWNPKGFSPNYWVDITEHFEKKIKAFQIYASENKQYPHPRSVEGITALAQKRGTEAMVSYAEALQLIRQYW